jgi:predicted SAM-dependent methyltransferase
MRHKEIILNLGAGDMGHTEGILNVDCRKLPNIDVVADVKDLPYKDGEVDGILNRNLIEHFGRHEIKDLLKEWARVLKPGGKIQIETVDAGRTMTKWKDIPEENLLDGMLGAQTYPENFHKMLFTDKILERFIKEAGFEILNIEQFEAREIPRIRVTAQKLYDSSFVSQTHGDGN